MDPAQLAQALAEDGGGLAREGYRIKGEKPCAYRVQSRLTQRRAPSPRPPIIQRR
jgi:hypothetical protein